MNLQEIYKDFYFSEIQRKESLNNYLAIPLGILSTISAAFVVVAKEIDSPFDCYEIIQLAFLILTAISLFYSGGFVVRAWIGHSYAYMPSAKMLMDYQIELKNYYIDEGYSEDVANEKSDNETLAYICGEYAKNSEINSISNKNKSAYLFLANRITVISALLMVVSSIPYVLNEISKPEEIQKIEVSNIREIINPMAHMPIFKELYMGEPTAPKSPSSAQPPKVPQPTRPKPTPPKSTISMEGHVSEPPKNK